MVIVLLGYGRQCRPSALFLKTPKNLSARKFFAELFFKKATLNSWLKLTPHIAFSFGTKGAKEKALQKENAVLWGVAPSPIRFLKKAKQKTFKLGHSNIKFEAAYPDGVELTKVERTIFENSQKPFCKKVFCGAFFQKSDPNLQHKLTTIYRFLQYPQSFRA